MAVAVRPGRLTNLHAAPGVDLAHEDPTFLTLLNAAFAKLGVVGEIFSGARTSGTGRWSGVGFRGDPHDYTVTGRARAVDVNIGGKPAGEYPGAVSTLAQYGLESGNQPNFYKGKPDPAHVQSSGLGDFGQGGGNFGGGDLQRYGFSDLETLWVRAGGAAAIAPVMAALALAESQGDPKAQHRNSDGSTDYGLWQVNSVHGYDAGRLLSDPLYNARAAVSVQHAQGFHAWTTFNTGAYKTYLDRASANGPSTSTFTRTRPSSSGGGVLSTVGGAAGTVAGGAQSFASQMFGAFGGSIGETIDFLKTAAWLVQPRNWLRLVEFLVGGLLMLLALVGLGVQFARRSELVGDAASVASSLPGPAGAAGRAVTITRAGQPRRELGRRAIPLHVRERAAREAGARDVRMQEQRQRLNDARARGRRAERGRADWDRFEAEHPEARKVPF